MYTKKQLLMELETTKLQLLTEYIALHPIINVCGDEIILRSRKLKTTEHVNSDMQQMARCHGH